MKIAYLANVRIPSERAHATQIIHMCQAFAENGHEVDLFASTRAEGTIEDINRRYKLTSKFNLLRLSYGVFNPKIRVTFYLSELYFTLGFLLKTKPKYDYLYSRSEWIVWFLSFFVSKQRLVWESHEGKLNLPARRILKAGVKTVAISDGVAGVCRAYSSSVLVAYDGIDASFFDSKESKNDARQRLGIDSAKPVAMYIGGLEGWKGIDIFCRVAQLTDNLQCVVIGGSDVLVNEFKAKYPEVLFLGSHPYADLPHNQQAADILVIPNTAKEKISSSFTSPLKLFAHMTSGIPLVVSRVPSLISVTGDQHVSTFEPDNPTSLAESLKEIIANMPVKQNQAKMVLQQSKEYLWTERAKSIINFVSG